MRIGLPSIVAMLTALAVSGGCALMAPHAADRGRLQSLETAPESVGLEVFFARFPYGDKQLGQDMWNEIDEQALSADARRQWAANGIRAGIVGTQVPRALQRLLKITDEAAPRTQGAPIDLESEPTVTLRVLQTRPGRRSEIITTHSYDQLPLLTREAGQVVGRTYPRAETRLALRAFPARDGRVEIDLLPELHYGEQQQRWTATDGVIRLQAARPKRVFEDLRLKASLSGGQMLVLSCQADHPGSIGHYFFTEPTSEALAQKLLIIRLAQADTDRSFSNEPAPPRGEAAPAGDELTPPGGERSNEPVCELSADQ